MLFSEAGWGWQIGILVLGLFISILYIQGWIRLRHAGITLASVGRLFCFLAAITLLYIVTIWPLYQISNYLLTARAIQKVCLCMLIPPLFWLACPFHIILSGMPAPIRRGITKLLLQPSSSQRLIQRLTQPSVAWLGFVAAFLTWHDPAFATWTMENPWRNHLALYILLAISLLYWSHILNTGPRIHPILPSFVCFAYIIGVEIANMITGITIAFSAQSIYPHYQAVRLADIPTEQSLETLISSLPLSQTFAIYLSNLPILEDQMVGGAITWVTGSFVYIFSAVAVLNRLFKKGDIFHSQERPTWDIDADERSIAPGLEHRVKKQ